VKSVRAASAPAACTANTATLRTVAVTAPTATYTAAEQTADFGSPQGSIRVRVFQISETVGRGIMRSATL
jgi:hypothetical protein